MKNLLLKLSLVFIVVLSSVSQATLIEVVLDKESYETNEVVSGQIVVSDFVEPLGGFFSVLEFEPENLTLVDWNFGSGFDMGITSQEALSDSLYLEEYSLAFDESELVDLQNNSFTLASFSFLALTEGSHALSFNSGKSGLLDFFFFELANVQFSGGTVNVSDTATSVPTPPTLLLFAGSLLLLSRKRKQL